MSQSDADQRAADAVVRHHAELAATLTRHVAALLRAAEVGSLRPTWQQRDELVTWLHEELLPHALAEEEAMYPAAAEQPGGRLLVQGMLGEHRTIKTLIGELEQAVSPVGAASAGRALQAVFSTHLAKENDLVVPLLVGAADVSLAALLDGMHDLLGANPERTAGGGCGGHSEPAAGGGHGGAAHPEAGGGCGCGGHSEPAAGGGHGGAAQPAAGGCGGGGGCGCGGDAAGAADAQAHVLSIDPRLDVRDLPHGKRHGQVLAALDALAPDGALVLIAPHAPLPLLAEIEQRFAGQVDAEWLQEGPDVWQIRLHRSPATV